MKKPILSKRDSKLIESLLVEFEKNRPLINNFLQAVLISIKEDEFLKEHIHTIKHRIKDPSHLRKKLHKKILESKVEKKPFTVTKNNLLEEINDLAGLRILHLYTTQIVDIDQGLKKILFDQNIKIVEGPFARTWDNESKDFFNSNGIQTEESKTLYTSVHYVIESTSRKKTTCEIQVRTLSEEVWGK